MKEKETEATPQELSNIDQIDPNKNEINKNKPNRNQLRLLKSENSRGLDEDDERANLHARSNGYREGSEMFRDCYFKQQSKSHSIVPYVSHNVPFTGNTKDLKRFYRDDYQDDADSPHDADGNRNVSNYRKRKKKAYTFQFKMAVVKEAFKTSPFAAAEKFKIFHTQVMQWKKNYSKMGPQACMSAHGKKQKQVE